MTTSDARKRRDSDSGRDRDLLDDLIDLQQDPSRSTAMALVLAGIMSRPENAQACDALRVALTPTPRGHVATPERDESEDEPRSTPDPGDAATGLTSEPGMGFYVDEVSSVVYERDADGWLAHYEDLRRPYRFRHGWESVESASCNSLHPATAADLARVGIEGACSRCGQPRPLNAECAPCAAYQTSKPDPDEALAKALWKSGTDGAPHPWEDASPISRQQMLMAARAAREHIEAEFHERYAKEGATAHDRAEKAEALRSGLKGVIGDTSQHFHVTRKIPGATVTDYADPLVRTSRLTALLAQTEGSDGSE